MKRYIIVIILICISCKKDNIQNPITVSEPLERIETEDFKLLKVQDQKGLLILFPCFPCDAANTFTEFNIEDTSIQHGFSILAMNFNQHLYLDQSKKKQLAKQLESIVTQYGLQTEHVYLGGFSSGGNVSLLLSDYLIEKNSSVQPEGIFIVDSPIDLLALYKTAHKNLAMNFAEPSVNEAKWIIDFFDNEFGKPELSIANYEKNAPFTYETAHIENLKHLKSVKIRCYTEPDLKWWKEHRNNDREDLNAFYIKELSEALKVSLGNPNVELIRSFNRGYRADGTRHPHSWSIVDEKELMKWMTE